MAATGNSQVKDDWIHLPPSSDQHYHSILPAVSSPRPSSGAEGQQFQEHNSSWWNIVQNPLNWITAGNPTSVDQGSDSVDHAGASNMAASAPPEQKKHSWIQKAGGAVKTIISKIGEPDEQWEHLEFKERPKSDKRVENEEEDVFSIILRDKTELQAKNTKLLKKIAELERKVKERESQVEKKERELQNLIKKQGQRDKPHALQRQSSYEKAVASSQGSVKTKAKDQEIRSLQRRLDNLESVKLEGEEHILEISRKDEEIRQLKENIERLRNQKSTAETGMETITKQAEYFEIQYCTEKEHTQRLQDEIKQLQQQLDLVPLSEPGKSSGGEEGSAKIIAHLRNRIKQLTDDTSKLKEHSLEQSRAVLSLRQQAEMSKHMEEQVQSMEVLLSETEGERDHLRKLLSERNVEHHRGTGQEVSMADIQAQNQELKEKLTQAEAQALVYKSDFEEERRDRERIHGLIDDLKKKKTQVEGRAEQEIAAYKQTLEEVNQDLQYTKEQLHKHKVLLADTETLNKKRVEEAQKAKDEADAARREADKYYQESEQFRQSTEYWRNQAEASKRDTQCIQAKASQVKQYAKEVEKLKQQRSAAEQNTKVLTDMLDKVTRERDQLKRQNLQLSKKNEQLKKKRKSSTDKVLASPDLPPEEDSTLIELEFAQQRADEADKRANAAEMRAMAAEKQAKVAEMKQHGAEARIAKREKQLDETYVQVQGMTSEIQRLNVENEQLRIQLSQHNPNLVISTPQSHHPSQCGKTWPISEDAATVGTGSLSHSQPLRVSLPEGPPQGAPSPGVTSITIGKPTLPIGLNFQSTAAKSRSQEKTTSPFTPTSGHTLGGGPSSGIASRVNTPQGSQEQTSLGEPVVQSTGHSSHSERVVGNKDALQLYNQPRSASQEIHSSQASAQKVRADQLSRRPLHDKHQPLHGPNQSHPSNLPIRDSSEMASPTRGSPQPLPRQGLPPQRKEQLSPSNPPSQSSPSPSDDTSSDSEYEDAQPNDDQYDNQLQIGVDDDIHKQAASVIKQVSGSRHQIKTDVQRPYDPNLICPMCMKKFRIGEIQKFKRHVNTCDGTDDDLGVDTNDDVGVII